MIPAYVKVAVRLRSGSRAVTRFNKRAQAEEFMAALELANDPGIISISVYHNRPKPPPDNAQRPAGTRWCPYCRKFTHFRLNSWLEVGQCEFCRISDHDFYVKTYNGLWGSKTPKKGKDPGITAHRRRRAAGR